MAGGCNVATRWHCDGALAVSTSTTSSATTTTTAAATGEEGSPRFFGGRPTSLLAAAGLEDLHEKWPRRCVAMGACAGRLTAAAAEHLGLSEGTPVAQGGADAFVGLLGLGVGKEKGGKGAEESCLLYTSPSPRDLSTSRMPSSA